MHKFLSVILVTSLCAAARVAQAQAGAAYVALVFTPVGALPPIMTSTIAGSVQRSAQLALRYGYLTGDGGSPINSVGVSGVLPMGLGTTLTLTGGVNVPDCRSCEPGLMLSVGGDTRLTEMPFGATRDAARLTISLNGELGYGQARGGGTTSLISGEVGLPIGLVSGGRGAGMRVVPFVTPAFGFGSESPPGGGGASGTRFMLGGGVGIYNPISSVVLNLGFQHVAIDNGSTQIGLVLMFSGR